MVRLVTKLGRDNAVSDGYECAIVVIVDVSPSVLVDGFETHFEMDGVYRHIYTRRAQRGFEVAQGDSLGRRVQQNAVRNSDARHVINNRRHVNSCLDCMLELCAPFNCSSFMFRDHGRQRDAIIELAVQTQAEQAQNAIETVQQVVETLQQDTAQQAEVASVAQMLIDNWPAS
ncbi:unnamed protein product [Sphagnum balticum]